MDRNQHEQNLVLAFRHVKEDMMRNRNEVELLRKEQRELKLMIAELSTRLAVKPVRYNASKKGTKFHDSCEFSNNIKPENLTIFSSKIQAMDQGFHPCACVA